MSQTYVALDLETTGLSAERDAIIEIGAVKFRGDQTLDTFSTFVDPGRPIPLKITELTGIRDEDVADAPGLFDVLPALARFVGKTPVVGHSVNFDLAFLQQHSDQFTNDYLDTFELASVLCPDAERYSLQSLAQMVGINIVHAHRALDDAVASQQLFGELFDRAQMLPLRILKEIVHQGKRGKWAAGRFFQEALKAAAHRPPGQRVPDQSVQQILTPTQLMDVSRKARRLQAAAEPTPLDVDGLAALLETDGAFYAKLPGYEHRPQQVAMLRRVAQALNGKDHLLVEAPTGVGKSLAYLIPAVYWGVQNGQPVIISTNTINLQEQLYQKDLPTLARILPIDFRATVLKGRSHYLCQARLQATRRRGARSAEEARVLAKILVWLLGASAVAGDGAGDGDRLFLPDAVEQAIWRRLSADNEGCNPERCRYFQQGACYFYGARRAAESSHLIIVNHALLLADVAVQNRVLPEYKHLIVDEAHHLESATTNGLHFETDQVRLRRTLREIGHVRPNGRVTGLLADVMGQCQKVGLPEAMMAKVELSIGKVGITARRALEQLTPFFEALEEFVEEHQQGRRDQYAFRMRVTPGLRVQPAWETVEITWDNAYMPVKAIVDTLEELIRGLGEIDAFNVSEAKDLQTHVLGIARQLKKAGDQISQMIYDPDDDLIYWIERNVRRDALRLHAAPLHVGPMVEKHLFHEKESVILTSATLQIGGSFDFLRERLNAWDADELVVGSPFDYENSTLVYLIDDIPEPGQQGYQRAVEQGMAALFRATGGRAMALFTSYSQLRSTLQAIKAPLTQAGITVQAQGQGVSRVQLLENFSTGERRVLLGTRSFWEGVDVPGEALSCLAIAKLPFSVPSDPIFAARSETFEQPFFDYAVPETILRFLQGFGRLIRTRSDRGVVAVFDKRLLTKSYGPFFLESLPHPTIRQGSVTLLPQAAAQWIDRQT
ncbi:MAG TPA: DEAD/DEAH box helicase [Chloroflexi bacterium]|nr:DEAD/DEAH box helicase [Chloroflexota bacterium]